VTTLPTQPSLHHIHMKRKRKSTLFGIPMSVAIGTTVVLSLVLTTASASAAEVRTFTGQKNCSTAVTISPPTPGGYCLITQSTLKILMGAKVYYTNATVVAGILRSPVTLVASDKRGSTATGQCTYYRPAFYPPGHGLCTYSSGTGKLAGFRANVVVGPPTSPGVFSLAGTYWFDRDDSGDKDHDYE
jgi:hypothetical protein